MLKDALNCVWSTTAKPVMFYVTDSEDSADAIAENNFKKTEILFTFSSDYAPEKTVKEELLLREVCFMYAIGRDRIVVCIESKGGLNQNG